MECSLFETLTAIHDTNARRNRQTNASERVRSIASHLGRLFNARRGALLHAPDYGLPDISEIYRRMPRGADEFVDAVRALVERYEPRLRNVKVVRQEADPRDFKISLLLSGELTNGEPVRFQTTFSTNTKPAIAPWRQVLNE